MGVREIQQQILGEMQFSYCDHYGTVHTQDPSRYQERIVNAAADAYGSQLRPSDWMLALLGGYGPEMHDRDIFDAIVGSYRMDSKHALISWMHEGSHWVDKVLDCKAHVTKHDVLAWVKLGQTAALYAILDAVHGESRDIASEIFRDGKG